MTILGIETSTVVCSVGLANENNPISEKSINESHIHSEKLLTLIEELCGVQKIQLNKIDAVAISIGPGSFTGLRIGLSTAKGLCYALGKPLIAVPTFTAVSLSVFRNHPKINQALICVDAKQGEYYIGVYKNENTGVKEISPMRIGEISSLQMSLSNCSICITDNVDELKSKNTGMNIENIAQYCRGDIVAFEALQNQKFLYTEEWYDLEPKYLKDFIVKKH